MHLKQRRSIDGGHATLHIMRPLNLKLCCGAATHVMCAVRFAACCPEPTTACRSASRVTVSVRLSSGSSTTAHNSQLFKACPCLLMPAGEDVCREVSAVADQVVVAARSWKNPEWANDPRPFGPRSNVSRRGMVSALHPDGRVEFAQVRHGS